MRIHFILVLLILFGSCARRGRPTGGPKDEEKPIMVKAKPDFGSTHFNAKEIKIYFDEYIKLNELTKNLLISPPLKYPPVITPQGTPSKYITIELLDTLMENTTYTFNFGNSVIDNTEGNVLENFKYVVSTGDYVDSLKVTGTIRDAFGLEQNENVVVMLYPADSSYNDSIIYKQKPMYVGSLIDSIHFEISNIKEGKYHLIALADKSRNYVFNPKEDKIGFVPDIITVPVENQYDMVLFKEILPFRIPSKPKEVSKGKILIPYEGIPDSVFIGELPKDPKQKTFLSFEKQKDTMYYWFRNFERDSLDLVVKNKRYIDTFRVKLRKKEIDSLKINANGGTLNPRDTLMITTNTPVWRIDTTKIVLINKDSSQVAYKKVLNNDRNTIYFDIDQKFEENYRLTLFDGALTDFFGIKNDTTRVNFSTKKVSNYASVFLNLVNIERYPVIVDLIDQKGKVEASAYLEKPGEIRFEHINPSRFMVRVIYDDNKNGYWDTGNFLKKIQPEKVYYFSLIIEARSNWEVVETLIKDN